MDKLILDQHLILNEIFSQPFFLFLSFILKISELVLKFSLNFIQLLVLVGTKFEFLFEKSLFILKEISPIEKSFKFLFVSGYICLQLIVFPVEIVLFLSEFYPGILNFLLPQDGLFPLLNLSPDCKIDEVLPHKLIIFFKLSKFVVQLILNFC